MRRAKLLALAVCALIPAITLYTAYISAYEPRNTATPATDTTPGFRFERAIRGTFPLGDALLGLRNRINLSGGRREIVTQVYGLPIKQRGIFVSENSLMKNIDEPVEVYVNMNIEGISEFAEELRQNRVQTYFMLIPTSGAILQQNLPRFADSVMINQRRFIDEVYSRISSATVTIDAYSPLFAGRNQYIYYRTENNLTSLGGYYVYSAMLPRLGLGQAQIKQFDVDYAAGSFYGDLARESGYTGISPDTLSLFRYSPSNRFTHEFLVMNKSAADSKTYHTLYPMHAASNGNMLNIFMGENSPVIDIYASTGYSSKILLFSDRTAIAYAPLLANNCERLTIVNLSSFNFRLDEIVLEDYDKIVFAFNIETFMQMPEPSRAALYFINTELYE